MIGMLVINAGFGLALASSTLIGVFAIWPIAIIAVILLAFVAAVVFGFSYGVCVAMGQRFWFPHRVRGLFPSVIWHVLWGIAANLITVSAIFSILLGSTFMPASTAGGYLAIAGILWLVSIPHLMLAWRTSLRGNMEARVEPPRAVHFAGLAVTVTYALIFIWSVDPASLGRSLGGEAEVVRLGDQTYYVPTRSIRKRHLNNVPELDRRWILLRMRIGGSDDSSVAGLGQQTFNVHVVEEPVGDWQSPIETLECARNLFGEMSGCWRADAKDWEGAYPFAKPAPDSVFEFHPPRVVSRIDIVVLDGHRRYQALVDGLTGQVYLNDGRAVWRFRVPDDMLKDLDKIIVATRAFQERMKQRPQTSAESNG